MSKNHEELRLERIAQREPENGWQEAHAPGGFGCHEALDRVSLVQSLLDRAVCSHPSLLAKPEWYAMAEEANQILCKLYQAIGAEHL